MLANHGAASPSPVDVADFLDGRPVGRYQILLVALCFLTVAIDGLDLGLASYIAPAVRAQWGLSVGRLTPMLLCGLAGRMVGALVVGPLADRWGRRPALLGSVALFGVATLAGMAARTVDELSALRMLAGIGIGGATPTAVALTAEYVPSRRRMTLITLMLCGNSLGSAFGGVIASQVIPRHGWRAMLMIGGGTPLVLLVILGAFLPESMRYLALRHPQRQDRLRALGRRITGCRTAPDPTQNDLVFVGRENQRTPSRLRDLLAPHYRRATLLLWATFFLGLSAQFLMLGWLPTVITRSGSSLQAAALTTTLWSIGGTTGGVALGRIMDAARPNRVLGFGYVGAALALCLVGQTYRTATIMAPFVFAAGMGISGTQVGLNGLASALYPTALRATGVAWATGIGRIGSLLGTAFGGLLLSATSSDRVLFVLVALPVVIAACCLFAMPGAPLSNARTERLAERRLGA